MKRSMMMIAALASLTACGGEPQTPKQALDGRPGLPADKEAVSEAQANATNDAALNSPRPNTLQPGDLTNSTTDVGGGAAVDNGPPAPHN